MKFTKLCLESLLANTSQIRFPFEIIVVDNASSDGSVEYLKGLETAGQVKTIYNKTNEGYPKANNQGANIAKGEYLCLCNNDIVFTEGWLDKLLRCIKSDSKLIAVGPYSSYASGHQQATQQHKYINQEELNKFSVKFSQEEQYVDFLVFFCVLIKKNAWDEFGGLDETFGKGNYEDNLFCYGAIEKGYKLKVCNAYVYHFGGISFGYNQEPKKRKEYASLLAYNQKMFYLKIGQYKYISLCMIVADSEKPETLKRCLDSVQEWIDEVCIVFNYKKMRQWAAVEDYSKRIFPKKFKSVLYSLPCDWRSQYIKWTNFSDMRNKSLDIAMGDYALWLDCDDEIVTPQGVRDIILKNPNLDYFQCQVHSFKENGRKELIYQNRLFKNNPNYRFRNSAHEDVAFSMLEQKAKGTSTNIIINHLGNLSFKDVQRKNLRNMKLLWQDYKAGKAHSLTYFGLVNCYLLTQKAEDYLKAIELVDECFEKCVLTKEDALTPKMWVLRGGACYLYWRMEQIPWALAGAKQSFLKAWDEWRHPEAAISLAEILMIEKDYDKTIEVLNSLLEIGQFKIANVPIDMEEVEVKMFQMLGDCWMEKAGQIPEANQKELLEAVKKAEEFYCKCLYINKNNLYVADKLIKLMHSQGRFDQAAFLTVKLINQYPQYNIGWINMAQYELMNKRYRTAEVFLRIAVRKNPQMKEVRHNLAMVEALNRKRG